MPSFFAFKAANYIYVITSYSIHYTKLYEGLMGVIYGAQIVVSRLVPVGTVYLCCEAEHFGRIPVRTELTVLSADDPKARTIGFSVFENLGIGAYNPRGLARLTVTR